MQGRRGQLLGPTNGRLGVCLVLALTSCAGATATSHYHYPRQAAHGRTETCPKVRAAPLRDGNVSPDAAKCSYADANGADVTHVAGKVLAEGGPGDPGTGVAEVHVSIHAIRKATFNPDDPGPSLARGVTDAQGNYSLRGMFVAGEYGLVVREPAGKRLSERVVRVSTGQQGSLRGIHIVIPVDPRLKADAAPQPKVRTDPTKFPPPRPPPEATPETAPKPGSDPTSSEPAPATSPLLRPRPPPGT